MMPKISLFKIFKNENKRNIGMYALTMLIYVFTSFIPFIINTINLFDKSISMNDIRQTQLEILSTFFGFSYLSYFITLVLSIVLAIYSFSFLHYKNQVDFYHSFPIKRSEIFIIKYLSGFSIYFLVYIFFQIIVYFFSILNGMSIQNAFTIQFIGIILNLLFFLLCYTITVFAMLLTGKIIIGFMVANILLFFGIISGGIFLSYYNMFFDTFKEFEFNNNYFYAKLIYLSPIYDYFNILFDSKVGTSGISTFVTIKNNSYLLIFSLLTIVALIFINVIIYNKRKLETCTNPISENIVKHIIRDILVINISLCGIYFSVIRYGGSGNLEGQKFILAIICIIILGIIIHCIIEIMFNQDFKMLFSDLFHMIISIAISLFILFIFKFDLLHFDSYLPKLSDVKKVMFDVSGETCYNYYKYNDKNNIYENIHDQIKDKFENSNITNEETIKAALNLSKIGIDNITQYKLNKKNIKTNKNERNDDSFYSDKNFVNVVWTLKNGKVINRKYYINLKENIKEFNKIYSDVEYKKSFMPFLRDEDKYRNITINEFSNKTSLYNEDMEILLKLLKKDIIKANIYCKYKKQPITILNCYLDDFYINGDKNNTKDLSRKVQFPVYAEFDDVINFLVEKNIPLTPKEVFGEDARLVLNYGTNNNITVNDYEKREEIFDSVTYDECTDFNRVFGFNSNRIGQPHYVLISKSDDEPNNKNQTRLSLIKNLTKNILD